ncbi:MAG: DUF1583 domain-containing protein [Thermoguttaceae bacterium]|jgi:hypothetical protein
MHLSVALLSIVTVAMGADSYTDEYRFDFRNGQFDNRSLELMGVGAARMVKSTAKGVQLAIPSNAKADEVGLSPRMRIQGDFEIRASFEIVDVEAPKAGYGIGPSLYLATDTKEAMAATLSRVKRVKDGEAFVAHSAVNRDSGGTPKRQHRARKINATSKSGTLCLIRSGNRLQYLAGEGETGALRQVDSVDFTDADVRQVLVRLVRNGDRTGATIVWKTLEIRAERLVKVGEQGSRSVLAWVSGLMLLLAATTAAGWYWLRKKSSGASDSGDDSSA